MMIDWQKNNGLIPAVIQNSRNGQVLMLGYMNAESLELTQTTRRVTFFSRSRQKIWVKGETSANFLNVTKITLDCDQDTLLIQAVPEGPVCHLGTSTCFGDEDATFGFLNQLANTIDSRFKNPSAETSYIGKLIERGEDRIIQKVGEEAVEIVIAAKGNDLKSLEGEAADLLFHLMVLLRAKGTSLSNVTAVLEDRHLQTLRVTPSQKP